MLKPFTTERLAIRQLQVQDAPELASISDVPAVSQWMAFMEDGFPLEKAQALITDQNNTKEYFFAVRLPDGTLIGATGAIDHPDGTIEVSYWLGVNYQGNGYATEALLGMLAQIAADPTLAPRPILLNADLTMPPPSGCLPRPASTPQVALVLGPTGSSSNLDKDAGVGVRRPAIGETQIAGSR